MLKNANKSQVSIGDNNYRKGLQLDEPSVLRIFYLIYYERFSTHNHRKHHIATFELLHVTSAYLYRKTNVRTLTIHIVFGFRKFVCFLNIDHGTIFRKSKNVCLFTYFFKRKQ